MNFAEIINLKDLVTDLFSNILFWLFSIIITIIIWVFKKFILPHFQKIIIKSIDVRNVPKMFEGELLPSFQNSDVYRNYIENELVIQNEKDDLIIKDLIVENIVVNEYFYEDIVVQNGFDVPKQKIDFVVFNNGNKESSLKKYILKIIYINNLKKLDKCIFEKNLTQGKLKGGDIEKIFSMVLTNHNIIKYFSNDIPDYRQSIKIELLNTVTNQIESDIEIPYLSSEKKFIRQLGGGSPVDRTLTPIIELLKPYNQSKFTFTINYKLTKGVNQLRFNILVDGACQIKYSVRLMEDENKELARFSKDSINIRFPNYKLTSPYKDELYHYLISENIKNSNLEEVKLRQPSLMNSIDKTKQEYNLL
ncbi:hypothetical protein [Streptococcus devriesei]|uniref:hypothetical protein n=1 Tax=Streptococcus devriesei TaxID=231233 RepID=UPI00040A96F9|nr:hypothetical protein [Streptococcus devriesei]